MLIENLGAGKITRVENFSLKYYSGYIWYVIANTFITFEQVKISDNAIPQLYSITIVEVEITDENDNAPEFLSNTIDLHLPQDGLPLQKAFYKVTAFDPDSGNNGRIIYSLRNVSSQLKDVIYVDSEYGWLYAKKTLLRLSTNFIAIATNGRQSSESRIRLNVIECVDEKDFVVKNSGNTFQVSEDRDIKTEVIKISIEPANKECIRYFLDCMLSSLLFDLLLFFQRLFFSFAYSYSI